MATRRCGALRKRTIDVKDGPERAEWEQWLGLVERGKPDTLVLKRMNAAETLGRPPGPGPIQKAQWQPVAEEMLIGRSVILHTDSVKAYSSVKGDRFLHDNVVRK